MRTILMISISVSILSLGLAGCVRHPEVVVVLPPPPRVDRVADPARVAPGRTDDHIRALASDLVADCLARPWARRFRAAEARSPVIRVNGLRNHALAVTDVTALHQQLEVALVRSGRARVAGLESRAEVAAEVADQQVHASDATLKTPAASPGSDFVLSGWIELQRDEAGQRPVAMVYLQLIDLRTSEKVWIARRALVWAASA